MANLITGISVFKKLLDIFDLVQRGIISRDEKVDEALEKTHVALVETQSYLKTRTGQNRDLETEASLSKLWYAASVPMRHVNLDFAKIIHEKGGYWSNSETWNELASGDVDITIKNVVNLTNKLFQS